MTKTERPQQGNEQVYHQSDHKGDLSTQKDKDHESPFVKKKNDRSEYHRRRKERLNDRQRTLEEQPYESLSLPDKQWLDERWRKQSGRSPNNDTQTEKKQEKVEPPDHWFDED